jgi:hypothetical protein
MDLPLTGLDWLALCFKPPSSCGVCPKIDGFKPPASTGLLRDPHSLVVIGPVSDGAQASGSDFRGRMLPAVTASGELPRQDWPVPDRGSR